MYPLIEIQTVPIQIQIKTQDATLEYKRGSAEMEISRGEGGLDIKSRPIRLQLDSFEASNSIRPTTVRSIEQAADAGNAKAYEATATYAQRGQLFVDAKLGQDVMGQISRDISQSNVHTESGLEFLPSTGVEISWEEGDMQIRYEMDKINFDWKITNGEFKFTPGDIKIEVEQQPDVIIKYVGGPLYVPPSADPNYESVDVKA